MLKCTSMQIRSKYTMRFKGYEHFHEKTSTGQNDARRSAYHSLDNVKINKICKSSTMLFKSRGGSRISGKGVRMYKGMGFALLIISIFS